MNPVVEHFKKYIGQKIKEDISPSKVSHWLEGTIVSVEEGDIKMQFTVNENWINPIGTMHGGMFTLIADDVIGATMFSLNTGPSTTVNMNISFLKAAKLGEKITAHAQVVRQGRKLVHLKCIITNEAEKQLCIVSSNNMFL